MKIAIFAVNMYIFNPFNAAAAAAVVYFPIYRI
jgi:hypothetical protein